jgi:hypothetical protein
MGKKSKAKKTATKKPMGRPRTDPAQVGLTLLPETLESLDAYAEREGLTRHKAARRIIELFFERGRRLSEIPTPGKAAHCAGGV